MKDPCCSPEETVDVTEDHVLRIERFHREESRGFLCSGFLLCSVSTLSSFEVLLHFKSVKCFFLTTFSVDGLYFTSS